MTDLIKQVGLKKAKIIVENAPRNATTVSISLMGDQFLYGRCENSVGGNLILLDDLRQAIADYNTDDCKDIQNHISPNTVRIEKWGTRKLFF